MMNILELTKRDKSHLVQLCLPISQAKSRLKFPVLASEKLDGVYGLVVCTLTDTFIFSRTGEEYLSLNHLKPEFQALFKSTKKPVFICELYTQAIPQPVISGWCRDKKEQHEDIHAYVHDNLSLLQFVEGTTADTYEIREAHLCDSFFNSRYFGKYPHIHFIPQRYITNKELLDEYARAIWDKGGEGVVARFVDAPYRAGKRNAEMIKIKKGVSFELRVVTTEEGTGKFSGMVGNLICEDAAGKQIKVGTGMTTKERVHWWCDPSGWEDIIGKIVTVDAMSVSTKGVLREPRYKGVRTDKKEVDRIV